ncbi:uncharacterized protein LOC133789739 [Humulus lupulus]|uniref:uncharacterized protein LOC133789739 n=1 Tax=Humulus lupulus TaxID=3486 RepID=UPI002B41202C|nr:uncharacterized protein LOC133789739 [Humulus lupulus]
MECWYWRKTVEVKNAIKEKMEMEEFRNMKVNISGFCGKLWPNPSQKVWHAFTWNRYSFPKHKFITWLACQDNLLTKDRLIRFGITTESNCLLCEQAAESHQHIFFDCFYSKEIVTSILSWVEMKVTQRTLEACLKSIKRRKLSKFKREFLVAVLNAVVYCIWEARNVSLWEQKVYTVNNIVKKIKYDVCNRFSHFKRERTSKVDRDWYEALSSSYGAF